MPHTRPKHAISGIPIIVSQKIYKLLHLYIPTELNYVFHIQYNTLQYCIVVFWYDQSVQIMHIYTYQNNKNIWPQTN